MDDKPEKNPNQPEAKDDQENKASRAQSENIQQEQETKASREQSENFQQEQETKASREQSDNFQLEQEKKASREQSENFQQEQEKKPSWAQPENFQRDQEKKASRAESEREEPYNPFEHRNIKKPTSDFGALAHVLKTSLGSGILAMPMAFKNSGLVFGSVGTVVLGVICTHCIQMLIRNSQVLCARHRVPIMTFAETTKCAFLNGPLSARRCARVMGIMVTVQLLGSFIFGSSVYVVFMAQTMHQVFDFFTKTTILVRYYILMLWIPLILTCLVRDLKTLVPFSIIAILFVIVSFSIVLYYIFRDIHKTDSVQLIAPFPRLPLFLTTVIFAIEGIGTVMSIENEMRHPEHFIGGRVPIAYIAMTIVVCVYGFVGFFGYLQYGEATRGSITLNLPVEDPLAESVKILIAMAIFLTYPLQFYVPINLIIDMIEPRIKPKYYLLCDIMVRVSIVTLTIFIALVIPNLEPIITLVGAIAFSVLGLMMPSLIDTMTRYPNWGVFKWRLVKNILISVLSLVALVSGTYTSVLEIIK